jgi:hypothetical protein
MAMMTARQLRRFNGLIAQVAAARSRRGDKAPTHGFRILKEIEAPDLAPAIQSLERLLAQSGEDIRGAA